MKTWVVATKAAKLITIPATSSWLVSPPTGCGSRRPNRQTASPIATAAAATPTRCSATKSGPAPAGRPRKSAPGSSSRHWAAIGRLCAKISPSGAGWVPSGRSV